MNPQKLQEINCFTYENPTPFPTYLGSMQTSLPYYQTSLPGLSEQTLNSTCYSTSDEAEDQQIRIIDERRQRRMISNRESARRSRMRKQRYLNELWSLVLRLRNENHSLLSRMNDLSESHDRIVQENARLKEEASDLRKMFVDLQGSNSYTILRDLEDVPCNAAHLRAEAFSQSVSTPTDVLH